MNKCTVIVKKEDLRYLNYLISSDGINLILVRKNLILFINEDKNGIIKIVQLPTTSSIEMSFKISSLNLQSILNVGYLTFLEDTIKNELCIGYTPDKEQSAKERFRLIVREPLEQLIYDDYSIYLNIFTSKELVSNSIEFTQYLNLMLRMCSINENGIQICNNIIYNLTDNRYIFTDAVPINGDFALTDSHLKELSKFKEDVSFTRFNNYLIVRTGSYTVGVGTAYIKEEFNLPTVFINDDLASLVGTLNIENIIPFLKTLSKTKIKKMTTVKSYIDLTLKTLNLILGQTNFIYKIPLCDISKNNTGVKELKFRIEDLIDISKFLLMTKLEKENLKLYLYNKNLRIRVNSLNFFIRLED